MSITILQPGTQVVLRNTGMKAHRSSVRVLGVLGEDERAWHAAACTEDGEQVGLTLFRSSVIHAPQERRVAYRNIERATREATSRFGLHPRDLTRVAPNGGFGCVTEPFQPDRSGTLGDLVQLPRRFDSPDALVTAALELSRMPNILDTPGNRRAAIDPSTGKVSVADMVPSGARPSLMDAVSPPHWQLPTLTDGDEAMHDAMLRYVLANCLLLLFVSGWAALPRCASADPAGDLRNGKASGPTWDAIPRFVRDAFAPLADTGKSLRFGGIPRQYAPDWEHLIGRLRTHIIACGSCGNRIFKDGDAPYGTCPVCAASV